MKYELAAGGYYVWNSEIIFVQYLDNEDEIVGALVANEGHLYERVFAMGFFVEENVRFATFNEVEDFLSLSPHKKERFEQIVEELVSNYWSINERPSIVLDPFEQLHVPFLGAYEESTRSLIFHMGMIALLEENEVKKTVLHELCHWYLHITGQNYKDGDVRFAQEIIRVGADDTINFHREDARKAYEIARNMKSSSSGGAGKALSNKEFQGIEE